MKTTLLLLLLLLPFTAMCQAPPCLLTEVSPAAFSFGYAYPADCQYIASWMDDFIDCHLRDEVVAALFDARMTYVVSNQPCKSKQR